MATILALATVGAFVFGLISAAYSSKRDIDLRAAYSQSEWELKTPAAVTMAAFSLCVGFIAGGAWLVYIATKGGSSGILHVLLLAIGVVGICFFGGLGGYVLAAWIGPLHATFLVRVDFDGIEVSRPFCKPIFVGWDNIVEIVDLGSASSHSWSGTEVVYGNPGRHRSVDAVIIPEAALGLRSYIVTDILRRRAVNATSVACR